MATSRKDRERWGTTLGFVRDENARLKAEVQRLKGELALKDREIQAHHVHEQLRSAAEPEVERPTEPTCPDGYVEVEGDKPKVERTKASGELRGPKIVSEPTVIEMIETAQARDTVLARALRAAAQKERAA